MYLKFKKNGFTLLEIMVALSLFAIITIMVTSMYILSNRAAGRSSAKAEMAQNIRVSFNRINREVRQSPEVVTDLSSNKSEASSRLIFENGHNEEEIFYIKYYLDGTDLRRSEIVYYFPSEEEEYVSYNTLNQENESPEEKTVEDRLVGENFKELKFWKDEDLIKTEACLEKAGRELCSGGGVYNRN
ncbi:MAG: PilW family protein [Patescibacteria group bacterium]